MLTAIAISDRLELLFFIGVFMMKTVIGGCDFRRTDTHLYSSSLKGCWYINFDLRNPTGLGNFLKSKRFSQNQIKAIYAFMRGA